MVRPPRSRDTADASVKANRQENDATGTPSTRRLANLPSIILIRGTSISLITLTGCPKPWVPETLGRYAQRMLIENNIEDGVDFFHMDALSSAVAMKFNCDLQRTLMASSLYRLLGVRIGHGYESAKSRHLFREFIDASAGVAISEDEVVARYQRRAHNPLLVAAGFNTTDIAVPWLGGKRLRLVFGEAYPGSTAEHGVK